jgi:hypothetical protein
MYETLSLKVIMAKKKKIGKLVQGNANQCNAIFESDFIIPLRPLNMVTR